MPSVIETRCTLLWTTCVLPSFGLGAFIDVESIWICITVQCKRYIRVKENILKRNVVTEHYSKQPANSELTSSVQTVLHVDPHTHTLRINDIIYSSVLFAVRMDGCVTSNVYGLDIFYMIFHLESLIDFNVF